jgi:hypothetical protein
MKSSSEDLRELFKALAKAQSDMAVAYKENSNPFYKSKYADFASIIKASRKHLSSNGLCVIQRTMIAEDKSMILSTVLGHLSGQWIESLIKINPVKSDIQSLGSYITYLKRYSYSAIVGVATDDDDGESASVNHGVTAPRPPRQNTTITCVSEDQLEQLEFELSREDDLRKDILSAMKISSIKQMPKKRFMGAIQRIREIKSRKRNAN